METDILILGAGPAGLSTALHLAQLDPPLASRVLVLEKERHPRFKLCAGGLVADALVLLERLGLDVSEVPHVDAREAHLDFAGQGLRVRVPKQPTLHIIRRDEFDAWLAEKAKSKGIEIREQVTVKGVRPDADGVIVVTDKGEFRAKIVIGADGSNGVTRRCVLPNVPVYTARALEVITPAVPIIARSERSERRHLHRTAFGAVQVSNPLVTGRLLRADKHRPRNDGHGQEGAYFDFFPVPQNIAGYVWDFPTQIKGQPMRCWGIYDMNLFASGKRPPLKETLAEEMSRHGFDLGDYELKGYPIRWFDPFNQFSAPRVLLVGDAAGADPLFGEGISMALGYGHLAAREIVRALNRSDFSFRGYRGRLLRSPLGGTLTARWFFANLIYSLKWKWFQFLLWRILKPVVIAAAWVFILNWGKRMPDCRGIAEP